MKKSLLFFYVLFCVSVYEVHAQNQKLVSSVSNKGVPYNKYLSVDESYYKVATTFSTHKTKTNLSPLSNSLKVGSTYYDLQSNASMSRRIIAHGNGTVSMIWTMSTDGPTAYNTRGTGYNFFNPSLPGNHLLYPSGPTARLEGSTKTGFPSLAVLEDTTELVMAHFGTAGDYKMGTNTGLGSGAWVFKNANAMTVYDGFSTVWCRIATGGQDKKTIHIIGTYNDETAPKVKLKGVTNPLVYSMSADAGVGWDQQSVVLPGYDSTRYVDGSAENYSMDANDSIVAIVSSALEGDVTLWKSTNNGTSFTRTFVDSFIYAPTIDSALVNDTVWTSDGGSSVVIDAAGKVHVAYSGVRISKTDFFPGDMKLTYWNDANKQQIVIPITLDDVDGSQNSGDESGTYEIGDSTTVLTTPITIDDGRYGNSALLTEPSIAVDGNNVFILFSLPRDNDRTSANDTTDKSFRDIWIVASQDGGATWGKIQNISCTPQEEEFYITMAKNASGNYLHLLYQWDTEPGTIVLHSNPADFNEIRYGIINKAAVLAGTANCQMGVIGVNEIANDQFGVINNFPNPTSGITYFNLNVRESKNLTLTIFNSLGQTVYTYSNKYSVGNHTLSVDASKFASGIYSYSISSGDAAVSGKFIKE